MHKKEDGYYRGGSCKYKLTAHIVFVTKFRYKILVGKLDNDLKKMHPYRTRNGKVIVGKMKFVIQN